ncbi:MAG: tetratricopeptide repeat protein, partial [Bdellovibrionota bacterium]
MINRLKVVLTLLAIGPVFFVSTALAQSVTVDVSRIGDASHFEFSGVADWKYELKKAATGEESVILSIRGLKPDAIKRLKSHTDSIVKQVQVNEKGLDEAVEFTFALKPGTDFFDYLTEQPSRLIVDFFPKDAPDEPAPTPKKSAAKAPKNLAKVDGVESEKDISAAITGINSGKPTRNPAGSDLLLMAKGPVEPPSLAEQISSRKDFTHGIFDGGDPEFRRFSVKDYEIKEDSIIASRANYYLPFPTLDLGQPQLSALIKAPPTYEIIPNDSKENQEARVLLRLFTEGKRGLFIKTANEFLKKFPVSSYDEIVRYMIADTHYAYFRERGTNYDFELAMNQYNLLTEKYPKSPITPRTLLLIGYSYMDRGDSFGALKSFQRFSRANETSKHIDQVGIASAEAYLRINKFDDAINSLEKIEKTGRTDQIKHDAAFRKGGVFFRKQDWAESIKFYQESIKKYGDISSNYPNAFYNIAEAEFRRGNYRTALDSYRTFLQKFPDHEHGGYAMTRLGELLNILGVDGKRAQGAFLESSFRYRGTPGAGIARIRFLASRMPEMKEKELASALEEIQTIKTQYAETPPEEELKDPKEVAAANAKEKAEAKIEETKPAEHGEPKEGEAAASHEVAASDAKPIGEGVEFKRRPVLPGIEEFVTMLVADG